MMPNMNMIQSLNSALDIMLERDPNVIIFGEDVGYRRSTENTESSTRPFQRGVSLPRRLGWGLTD